MSISTISSPTTVRTPDRDVADVSALRPPRNASVAPASATPIEQAAALPSEAQLKDAVSNINKSLQALSQDLVFSIDSDSNRTIVKVVDQKTNEVIRQIPSPEALEIAKALDTVQGLLIKQTA
jgi:flagellar protein FlaG